MLADLSEEQKQKYQLGNAEDYFYLNQVQNRVLFLEMSSLTDLHKSVFFHLRVDVVWYNYLY